MGVADENRRYSKPLKRGVHSVNVVVATDLLELDISSLEERARNDSKGF